MEVLANQCGKHSRFSRDPLIPCKKFVELYLLWIKRSLNKELADEVLVVHKMGKIAGMVTLGSFNGVGKIWLLAVNEDSRGRKYGQALVKAAIDWFDKQGCHHGLVVTQAENIAACNLYKKCGFKVEKVEYYYHFWL